MRLLIAVLALFASGCATTESSAYQKAAGLPTPSTLAPNSRWAFVLLDANDKVAANIVLRLSDLPMTTCDGGNYRAAEVMSEHRTDNSVTVHNPAYIVEGAALRIQLSTGLCDDGYAVIGGVTEAGFEGIHMPEVMIVPKSTRTAVLRAIGVPIPD